MLRLVAYAHNGVQRFSVDRNVLLIGSSKDCDVHLPFAGVGRQHARLETDGDQVHIVDLGSRKGMVINGQRVKEATLQVLDEIRLGSIALLLEDVLQPTSAAPPDEPEVPPEATITHAGMLDHLARISQWVLSDSSSSVPLESLVVALLKDFGGGVLFLFQGERETRGIKFVVASEARWLGHGEELLRQVYAHVAEEDEVATPYATATTDAIGDDSTWIAWRAMSALERPYLLVLALPRFAPAEADTEAALSTVATLADQLVLGLVHHVGQYEPIIFGRHHAAELVLAPGLIVGESEAMGRVQEALKAAIDPPIDVLLRGEPGVSKELLAHSLHLSGPHREGPFVVASCRGAGPYQIEADLFGVELQGKTGPVEREGKILEADGGTLYLADVEALPLPLQDRLVRFLRSGEVEPVESLVSRRVKVRLIASSREALEPSVSRDQFRIDLAYRLSELTIDVPSLRERREDLPLLLQVAVNRCCHKAGKRIQGITTKALSALAIYDYPGNLPELENIVRHLVHACPSGRPIQLSMLPQEVQLAKIPHRRLEPGSELNLERLVADCERAAIREALRRSRGNKSAAARELKLSRNGLAMKMTRLGLTA
jgi:transcriptional regulator with AAA-type ATPase domain